MTKNVIELTENIYLFKKIIVCYTTDSPIVAPVYYGNFIDAVNCAKEPIVEIEGVGEDSLWTLLLTSPDQNFVQGNVSLGDLSI